eukprot:1138666-Pelagomonas_calceolata.AAC.3
MQLNGLSLDLQLPQQPQQQVAPQLSTPPRRLDASQLQLLQRQQEAATAAAVVPASVPSEDFSLFSSQPLPERSSPAAVQAPPAPIQCQVQQQQQQQQKQQQQPLAGAFSSRAGAPASSAPTGPVLNEVVCGALMLAYERAGKWQDAVGVLQRARSLGLKPNTVMLNTAISAAGKVSPCSGRGQRRCRSTRVLPFHTCVSGDGCCLVRMGAWLGQVCLPTLISMEPVKLK